VDPDCSALSSSPIFQVVNPKLKTNLLTASQNEAQNAASSYGFTEDHGTPFYASLTTASGLVGAHRMYNSKTNDFFWTINSGEISSAVQNYGYVDQGINFYVSASSASCTQPVYRLLSGNVHRYAVSQADRDALTAGGWTLEGVMFYAAVKSANPPPADDPVFSIAILPDTQQEVQPSMDGVTRNVNDDRFINRTQWLANNKSQLNLKYVLHSGDVVNWGERDEPQYQVASKGMNVLEAAGIPYVLSFGNHDTRAVCAGGSACPGESAAVNLRLSPLFNKYFAGRFGSAAGPYVPYDDPADVPTGNISNGYSVFEAGGHQWLVLSLELWPRKEAVAWAAGIVASHPTHNVIVVTHSYLVDSNGTLHGDNGGYGSTSPQYLFDNLIRKYSNIRFVFSGHEGTAASYKYTSGSGSPTAYYLECFHSDSTNPVRVLKIDTANDTATSYLYAPKTNQYWNGASWVAATPTTYQDVKTSMKYVH